VVLLSVVLCVGTVVVAVLFISEALLVVVITLEVTLDSRSSVVEEVAVEVVVVVGDTSWSMFS